MPSLMHFPAWRHAYLGSSAHQAGGWRRGARRHRGRRAGPAARRPGDHQAVARVQGDVEWFDQLPPVRRAHRDAGRRDAGRGQPHGEREREPVRRVRAHARARPALRNDRVAIEPHAPGDPRRSPFARLRSKDAGVKEVDYELNPFLASEGDDPL